MTQPHTEPADLPPTIRDYLTAHSARDTESALRTFSPDATVLDQDQSFRGTTAIRGFLEKAGSQFTYTTRLTGVRHLDDGRWVATQRLEGDFPGGIADLDFSFALNGDLITELVIANH